MTLEEAIIHAEAVSKAKEREAKENRNHGGWAYDDKATKYSACAAEHRQLAEWLKELKSLKEKDEPKAVRYEGDGYADGAMVYDTAFCPNCEHEFEEDCENWECEFCPNCGQRLRWEE